MSELQPGYLVTPSLRLVRPLGGGGMGRVWVAEHLGLRTLVAVKFIAGDLAANAEALERFSREAVAASQVKSPHVVHMLDHGVTGNATPFIAMELLEGEDLAHRMARQRPLPPAEASRIITQIAKALARAHERGIVHRDIKPPNLFLCDVGEGEIFVKVLDFGIAKLIDVPSEATQTGATLGSPYYMSPEQVMGAKQIDYRTDLWSLGVVAFQALTGERPFRGESIGALYVEICHGATPLPSERNPSLPRAVDEWFAKACTRAPEGRFQTAKAMAEALDAALGVSSATGSSGSSGSSMGPSRGAASVASDGAVGLPHPPPSGAPATTIAAAPASPARGVVAAGAAGAAMTTEGVGASSVDSEVRAEARMKRRSPSRRWLAIALGAVILGGVGVAVSRLAKGPVAPPPQPAELISDPAASETAPAASAVATQRAAAPSPSPPPSPPASPDASGRATAPSVSAAAHASASVVPSPSARTPGLGPGRSSSASPGTSARPGSSASAASSKTMPSKKKYDDDI